MPTRALVSCHSLEAPAAGGGRSLELIDPSQANDRVVNWSASAEAGGTPGAANGASGTIAPVPPLYVNEVLPVNASINQDDAGEYDPWVEIYNASSQAVELAGKHLSNDLLQPTLWAFPGGTPALCGGCWLVVWADGDAGIQGPDLGEGEPDRSRTLTTIEAKLYRS